MELRNVLAGYYTKEEGFVNKPYSVLKSEGTPTDGTTLLEMDTKRYGTLPIMDEYIVWDKEEPTNERTHYFQVAYSGEKCEKPIKVTKFKSFQEHPWVKIIQPIIRNNKAYLDLDEIHTLGDNIGVAIPIHGTDIRRDDYAVI